jgi:hypothetical protein
MNNLTDLREQLQEDMITYFAGDGGDDGLNIDEVCQIIVDRVTELQDNEDYPDGAITSGDKKLLEMLDKAEKN